MIDITGADLREVVRAAYALSQPQGMGMLHFVPGDLSESDIDAVLKNSPDYCPVSMDYVRGRACKMHDHTPSQLQEFLKRIGKA